MRILLTAFVIAFSGAAAPGPMLALVVAQTLAQGTHAVVWILCGHAALEAVLIAGMAAGLSRLLQRQGVRIALGLLGGAVLAWMGLGLWAQADAASLVPDAATQAMPALWLFLAGIGVSLSNPYFTGWWATVGTGQVATLRLRSGFDYLVFFIGHEGGDLVWYGFVAAVLLWGRHWLSDPVYAGLLRGCAIVLVLLSAVFIGIGLRQLGQYCQRNPRP